MNDKTLPKPSLRLIIMIVLGLIGLNVYACDSDADCGVGGTCIKREKRGRGVCYGGRGSLPETSELKQRPDPNNESATPTNDGPALSPSGDAPIFGEEGYVEPTASPKIIDRLDISGGDQGACITSTDCAGGLECIYRDPMLGHGSCEQPPN